MTVTIIVDDSDVFVETWQGYRAIVEAMGVVSAEPAKDMLYKEQRQYALILAELIEGIEK